MFQKLKNKLALASVPAVAALATVPAHAAIDVSSVVSEISDLVTPIGLVGAAVLVVCAAIFAYKKLAGFISR